ncbi:hypothetical protein Q9295_13665 [Xinfangfangia sp. CPCC 101601]|uniref:RNase NYN domain-containing protein n=1 Tax=Pseudogemmobacter lacusdianii TaxID=3069608 RepID=A0ABU0W079_9RHOB|nr:hypothetical protein [Xinfangfangia sp. CPCC 101601]MDQ2067421.1 hypothetical protein [Xinfangfangia sp. CPCC 101601]
MSDIWLLSLFGLFLLAVLLALLLRGYGGKPRGKKPKRKKLPSRRPSQPGKRKRDTRPIAVVDGSNVMHWDSSTPQLKPVVAVLQHLEARGYQAGVIFDANAGYKLAERHMNDVHLARALGIDVERVLVVPKGQQADPFLLTYASDSDAIVISNDRFRDRIADYPKIAAPGRLIRGGVREGKLWLDLPGRRS